jgi:CelD/BcsL family acetyltransferase involved in cellulose biosynthesis
MTDILPSVTAYRGIAGIEELRDDWRRLTASLPNPRVFDHWESYRAYLRHFAAPDAMTFLAVREATSNVARPEAGALRAIVPLEERIDATMALRVPVLGTPLGDEWPRGDVVAPEDAARTELLALALAHARAEHGRDALLVLGPLPATSAIWDGLDDVPAGRVAAHPQFGESVIDCTRPADEVFSALSKNFRGNLRKARNRLGKSADFEFRSCSSPDALDREFDSLMAVESSGWKGESGTKTAIRFFPQKVAYYREMIAEHGANDRCRIDSLYVDGECVAAQLSFISGPNFEMFKIGFSEAHARLAPGQLLFRETLKRLCEDPVIRSLNLISSEPWHLDWGATVQPHRMARIALNGYGRALIPLARFRFTTARTLAEKIQRMGAAGGRRT